ncbi:hypothetical protein PGT21_014886 [Puccinia graminis f. sp. tritici]|uniref:Uncharacterized protein n=1 Tax=Puccinia graminis f. sp. tritici TaxID=56615 RepID=A0A5B0NG01_PUCGR|nr:hypothetical protein PGT21_014886 [Puccinia graminis f. sp. tritici]
MCAQISGFKGQQYSKPFLFHSNIWMLAHPIQDQPLIIIFKFHIIQHQHILSLSNIKILSNHSMIHHNSKRIKMTECCLLVGLTMILKVIPLIQNHRMVFKWKQ